MASASPRSKAQTERPDPIEAARVSGAGPVVLVTLVDFEKTALLWGWSRIVMRERALSGIPGLRFAKVLGSGHEGGFGLRPSASVQGLFCVFESDACADQFQGAGGGLEPWKRRAREWCTARLRAYSSRGSWSASPLAISATAPASGPVASLTRASIRPARAAAFWRMQPAAERSLEHACGLRLAVGLGEAPLLRQATFSIWNDLASMDAYARSGAHQEAIVAAARGQFFSESMFVRFTVCDVQGSWKGHPLA